MVNNIKKKITLKAKSHINVLSGWPNVNRCFFILYSWYLSDSPMIIKGFTIQNYKQLKQLNVSTNRKFFYWSYSI